MRMEYKITGLYVYPIKSLKGIRMPQVRLSASGFAYDRYWMLINEAGRAITQREIHALALFEVQLSETGVTVEYQGDQLYIPFDSNIHNKDQIQTRLFDIDIASVVENENINSWFSKHLNQQVRLVRQAPQTKRLVKNHPDASLHYADGGQYLILGQPAMDQLNNKLSASLNINRFRPNIVFEGGNPHDEDAWQSINIGDHMFEVTKSCARCNIPTINQKTSEKSAEPIRTLSTYRRWDKNIWFGRYFKLTSTPGNYITVDEVLRAW